MPKIENQNQNPQSNQAHEYTHFVGVKFLNTPRAYFFGTNDANYKLDDKVVVETVRGMELGTIAIEPIDIKKYANGLYLKPIVRKATDVDIHLAEINQKDAVFALEICNTEAKKLSLNMNLISCEYTLDKSKVIFSYLADDRVDFRELLKVLASRLRTRIELRQIGSRDKAKMIGGLGICGLPLCCSTFLNEFDGISINRAKNQMLAINIPKLSGQCGKLICCLKYEDDAYSEERKKYPELGSKHFIDKVEYTVTSINILSRIVKIENAEDIKFLPLEDFYKQVGNNNNNKNKERRYEKK
ncbi:MAG: stage 0 sporulation protein [Bacilli bacterium]|nr:stage 0 sporulation protein [Bacilli bacterium]